MDMGLQRFIRRLILGELREVRERDDREEIDVIEKRSRERKRERERERERERQKETERDRERQRETECIPLSQVPSSIQK